MKPFIKFEEFVNAFCKRPAGPVPPGQASPAWPGLASLGWLVWLGWPSCSGSGESEPQRLEPPEQPSRQQYAPSIQLCSAPGSNFDALRGMVECCMNARVPKQRSRPKGPIHDCVISNFKPSRKSPEANKPGHILFQFRAKDFPIFLGGSPNNSNDQCALSSSKHQF